MSKYDSPTIYRAAPSSSHAEAFCIAIAFFIVQLLLVKQHEMWLDELQAWSLARDSSSIFSLFQNLRYEGHPALWHLLVMPLTRLSDAPEAIQILHILIATGSIYLLAKFSPFSRLTIILISLSYYFFYEYAQIARNYAIGVFLAFAFCAMFPVRDKHPISLSIILALLAQTSVFGIILSACFGLLLLTEAFLSARAKSQPMTVSPAGIVAMTLILTGILLAILQISPPSDSSFAKKWYLHLDFRRIAALRRALIGGYIPIPPLTLNYWNNLSLLFVPLPGYFTSSLVTLFGIILTLSLSLYKRPSALIFFCVISVACLLFFYAKYAGELRHHGFLFVGLVISFWIAPYCTDGKLFRRTTASSRSGLQGASYIAFLLILSVQATAGVVATILDYRYTFSQLEEVALWIKQRMEPGDILIGTSEFPTSGVSGFLKTPMYFLDSSRDGTFIRWDSRLDGWDYRLIRRDRASIPPSLMRLPVGSERLFIVANGVVDFSGISLPLRSTFRPGRSVQEHENLIVYEFAR